MTAPSPDAPRDLLQEVEEALKQIVEIGARTEMVRVGDMYSEDGYEETTTVSEEAELAAALLPRLEAALAADAVVVPGEPTEEMVSAGYGEVTTRIEMDSRDLYAVYRAMLAAAPAVGEPEKRGG